MIPQGTVREFIRKLYEYDAEEILDALKYEAMAARLEKYGLREEADEMAVIAKQERSHSKRLHALIKNLGRAERAAGLMKAGR